MKSRRSQIMIKLDFQRKLIMSIVLISFVTINVIILAAELLDKRFGSEQSILSMFSFSAAGLEVVAIVIIFFVSRRISFRIAGPVYALQRTLRGMGEGKLDQTVKFRPGDQFVDVADDINRVMHDYRQRIRQAKELARQIDAQQNSEQSAALRRELEWFITESEAP